MNKSRFTEKQILFVLSQVNLGARIQDMCEMLGVSQATFYNWKNKYGSPVTGRKDEVVKLVSENNRLKKQIKELETDKELLWKQLMSRLNLPD